MLWAGRRWQTCGSPRIRLPPSTGTVSEFFRCSLSKRRLIATVNPARRPGAAVEAACAQFPSSHRYQTPAVACAEEAKAWPRTLCFPSVVRGNFFGAAPSWFHQGPFPMVLDLGPKEERRCGRSTADTVFRPWGSPSGVPHNLWASPPSCTHRPAADMQCPAPLRQAMGAMVPFAWHRPGWAARNWRLPLAGYA